MSTPAENKYRKVLKKEFSEIDKIAQKTISEIAKTKSEREEIATTIYVISPVLYYYVDWVIREAEEKRIERLYFLARDGYIFYRIGQKICEKRANDIECRYLYCSRLAWRIPSFHLERNFLLDKIFINSLNVNLDKVLERTTLPKDIIDELCAELGISEVEKKRQLTREEVLKYKRIFETSEKFINNLDKVSMEAYHNTVGYLRQEGLFEKVRFAIVDSGWTGSMQYFLEKLLKEKKIEGFYFGIYGLNKEYREKSYHSFYFSPRKNISHKIYFNNNLFESMCLAPSGMTIGYCVNSEGQYQPVFDAEKNKNERDIEKYINQVLKMVDSILAEQKKEYTQKKIMNLVFVLCKSFMVFPTIQEVGNYGEIKFSDDVTENDLVKLARELDKAEISRQLFFPNLLHRLRIGKYKLPFKQSAWIEGSITRAYGEKGAKRRIKSVLTFKWLQYLYLTYIKRV